MDYQVKVENHEDLMDPLPPLFIIQRDDRLNIYDILSFSILQRNYLSPFAITLPQLYKIIDYYAS